jgi:hypothetical protein
VQALVAVLAGTLSRVQLTVACWLAHLFAHARAGAELGHVCMVANQVQAAAVGVVVAQQWRQGICSTASGAHTTMSSKLWCYKPHILLLFVYALGAAVLHACASPHSAEVWLPYSMHSKPEECTVTQANYKHSPSVGTVPGTAAPPLTPSTVHISSSACTAWPEASRVALTAHTRPPAWRQQAAAHTAYPLLVQQGQQMASVCTTVAVSVVMAKQQQL